MTTLDLTNEQDKIETLKQFLNTTRNILGGVSMYLIIPFNFINLMYNVTIEGNLDDPDEFFYLGCYDDFRIPIYIDRTLTDSFYFFGNVKGKKVKVLNGC